MTRLGTSKEVYQELIITKRIKMRIKKRIRRKINQEVKLNENDNNKLDKVIVS